MNPKLESVISKHKGDITSCDFGPRERLATASSDHDVRIWDYNYRQKIYEEVSRLSPISHHTYSVNDVRFSPQGTMLATASSDGSTVLWDVLTGQKLSSFIQPSRLGVRVVCFSPDASLLLTGGDDESACVWDIATGILKLSYSTENATIFSAVFTPDGDHVVTGDANGDLLLWSLGNTKQLMNIEGAHDLGVMSIDICVFGVDEDNWEGASSIQNDFRIATGGNDDSIKIWKGSTGIRHSMQFEQKFTHHSSSVMCVKFSPDGKLLASAGGDKFVFLYEMSSGNVLTKIEHHNSYVGTCAFSRSMKHFATGSNDKQLAIWKLESTDINDSELQTNATITSEQAFSRETSVANSDIEEANQIELSHASILSEKDDISILQMISNAHTSDINDIVFITNELFISASSDKTVKLWSLESSDIQPLKTIDSHKNPIYSLCTNGEKASILATSALDGSVALWSLPELELIQPLFKSTSKLGIRVCRSSNDGQKIITAGDDDGAYIWNIENGKCESKLFNGGHSNTVFMACFVTEDGSQAVTGCNDGYLKVWNVKEEKVTQTVEEAHDLGVVCGATKPKMHLNSDEKYSILATGGNDSIIKIWKVFEEVNKLGMCEFVQELTGHGSTIMSLSFSPKTGKYLASTSGDKTIRIWNSASLVCFRVLDGHSRYVSSCAFNREEDLLVTGSNDKSIIVWSIKESNDQVVCAYQASMDRKTSTTSNDSINCDFICPITQDVMRYPVKCSDGFIYEKAAIQEWLTSRRKTSPMTNLPVEDIKLIPQLDLQKRIRKSITSTKPGIKK